MEISPAKILDSSKSWRDAILDFLPLMSVIVEYAVLERDCYLQTWLYHRGHKWVGNPSEEPEYTGQTLYNLYMQGNLWRVNALQKMRETGQYKDYLRHRDRFMRGAQILFVRHPEMLYLLCMYVEKALEQRAEDFDQKIENAGENSIYALHGKSLYARNMLRTMIPALDESEEHWNACYRSTFHG